MFPQFFKNSKWDFIRSSKLNYLDTQVLKLWVQDGYERMSLVSWVQISLIWQHWQGKYLVSLFCNTHSTFALTYIPTIHFTPRSKLWYSNIFGCLDNRVKWVSHYRVCDNHMQQHANPSSIYKALGWHCAATFLCCNKETIEVRVSDHDWCNECSIPQELLTSQ